MSEGAAQGAGGGTAGAATRSLSVEIVAQAAAVWSGQAAFVTVPTPSGTMGVYPRHQPVLSVLGEGEVRIQSDDGAWRRARVAGGFVSVDSDIITIVTDAGEILPD